MKLSEFYHKAIDVGMRYDPRHNGSAQRGLDEMKRVYDSLGPGERALFDMDSLWNPYMDSRIVCGDEGGKDPEFSKVIVGIDVPSHHVALDWGAGLVVSHHPEGRSAAGMYQVLDMQVGIWKKFGVEIVPIDDSARETGLKRLYEMATRECREDDLGEITEDLPDMFRYFGIPWIALHTAADNCATTYLQRVMDKVKPETLQDAVHILNQIPEYQRANAELIGPRIVTGRPKNRAGKVVVDMTGGTQGPEEIFASFADSGIKTVLCMHVTRGWYDAAANHHVQIVCAGHAPSDSLGVNLLLDEALPDGIEVYPAMGGFRRFSHKSEDQGWKSPDSHGT